jgi:DNA repair exonuclease SbcCD ATPase subunit
MKLIKFSWRNICSYGNKTQEFTVSENPQLILVEGKNGSGKSSIKEALTVSLYGKSAVRKTRDIPNRINRNAYTVNEFITSSGDHVKIERGIDPNFTNLEINGSSYNLPDKRKVDLFLEDELIKLPFSVFSNTISLSFEDFKSFIKLTPTDKRKIVDKIFGTDILTDMLVKTKDESKENSRDLEFLNTDILNNTDILEKSQEQLEILKNAVNEKKDIEIDTKNKDIVKKETEKDKLNVDLDKFLKILSSNKEDLQKCKDTLSKNNAALLEIDKKLKIYDNNKCPHCLSNLTDDSHIKIKDAIISKREIFENKIPNIEKSIKKSFNDVKDIDDSSKTVKNNIYNLDIEISSLKSDIKSLKSSGSDQTSSLLKIISEIQKKIDASSIEIDKKTKKQLILTEVEELLSDSGIKRALMDRIIPVLNAKILKISKQLEFKFSFEFNNAFDAIISHMGEEISSDSLSTGEQKKMNLIVLLSMLELIKMKHHQVNMLFLDEIFSSLDKESIYMTIEILKEFSQCHNLTIFVISHDPLPEELFDKKIMITKDNFFSEMNILSKNKSERTKLEQIV